MSKIFNSKKELHDHLLALLPEIKDYVNDISYSNIDLELTQIDKNLIAIYLLLNRK